MSAEEEVWGGNMAPHAIAEYLNTATVGFRLRISAQDWARLEFNPLTYDDPWHALRSQLWGSAHGAFGLTLSERGDAIIQKCAEPGSLGPRRYDDSGRPMPDTKPRWLGEVL